MKTYEKLAMFIELNHDSPQSCSNTTFTQDHKRTTPGWSIDNDMKAYIINSYKTTKSTICKHDYSNKQTSCR
jgi:hypothetical protein